MIFWTFEKLHLEALRFDTRGSFKKNSPSAYTTARKRKILDIICSHMLKPYHGKANPSFKWTDEKLKEEANKWTNRIDFQKNSSGAYQAAHERGLLDTICEHMIEGIRSPYTEEELFLLAQPFNKRHLFKIAHYGAYQAAHRLGILDKICAHMSKARDVSCKELELFNIIKQYYNKSTKLRDYNVNIKGKPHIKRFHIDIYVPELKLGIEFDGKYHHSFEYMRADPAKINWSDDDIRGYHEIKDSWFSVKGIKILHIKEEDWNKNKQDSINKCLEFLNIKDNQ